MNKYELGRTIGDKALCIVVDGDTAICASGDPRLGTSEHAEHMAYLVKAGNAHDELIAALRGIAGTQLSGASGPKAHAMREFARAALAKAGAA